MESFKARLFGKMQNRRVIRTTSGWLGVAPISTRVGDRVCILLGGATPFMIRSEGKRYRLIGECYVHGIMNGELIPLLLRSHAILLQTYEFV
jgi:hypothetical protein